MLLGHDSKWSDGSVVLVPVYLAFARLSGCCHCCWGKTGVSGMVSPPRRCQALIGTTVNSCGSRRSCKSSSPGFPPHCKTFCLSSAPHSWDACMKFLSMLMQSLELHHILSDHISQIQQTGSQVYSLC